MMVSGGSISLENGFADMSGLYAGVGGRLFFIFGPGFRLGTLGGTKKMTYGAAESRFEFTHSGLTAEWGMSVRNLTMAAGVLGGRVNYYILHKSHISDDGRITAREYENAVPYFSPLVSCEYSLSNRLRAAVVADYPLMRIEGNRHGGLRLGAGILFVK
jgi:hypothetical protein